MPGRLERSMAWALARPEETRRGRGCTEARVRVKMKNHEPDGTIIKENLIDIIARKIKQLPEAERNLPKNGSAYVGLNAALCGRIATSLFSTHLTCDTGSYSCWLTNGSDPIFDSKCILQRFCKFTFEYRWSALWNLHHNRRWIGWSCFRWPVPCFFCLSLWMVA